MILTDNDIRKYVNSGNPLIENFREDSLQSESYDLSIGKIISKYNADFKILDLKRQVNIDKAYSTFEIPTEGYLIGPREYILITIEEKLNMPVNVTAHVRPRTKFTRIGLIVSAQHCNSSYSGYLNLGLYNANPFAIKIYSGMKVAQIVFEELKATPSKEKQYRGHYQNEGGSEGADFTSEEDDTNNADFEHCKTAEQIYEVLIRGLEREE